MSFNKILFTAFCLLASINAFSQKDIKIPINQRVILNYPDYNVYAEILTVDQRIKPSDELYYYWFSANDIKRTRGGFDGKLLHGNYTEFYLNKNLKEKGTFRYGLKNKEWKSWHISGEYSEVSNWKKGKRDGKYRLYDKNGKLTQEGKYKDDLLNGRIVKYRTDGGFEVEKYKNGELRTKKEKKRFFGKKNKKLKHNKDKTTDPVMDDKVVEPVKGSPDNNDLKTKKEKKAKEKKNKENIQDNSENKKKNKKDKINNPE